MTSLPLRRLTALTLTACGLLPAGVWAQGRPAEVLAGLHAGRPHVPQQLLVQFVPTASAAHKSAALAAVGARLQQDLWLHADRADGLGDLHLVRLATGVPLAAAMQALQRQPGVSFAEPNWVYQRQGFVANDPYANNGALWGMVGAYGSQASAAWASGNGGVGNVCAATPVVVGVIDEGIMVQHSDLAANAWVNGYDSANRRDDDKNGYADDINGWDFAANNKSVYDGTGDDHGTHVAGTIGAQGGNGAGVAGMCWSIKMISAKFLGSNGGTTANAVKAINYLVDLKKRQGLNLVATNNSWGGGGYSSALAGAIENANSANILFIVAAGNSGLDIDATPSYPASYTNANLIAVAAIDINGNLASWSNYGAKSVHLAAPGVGIWSTLPGSGNTFSYGSYSGTSMATPHVTGAAALYAASHPGATAAQIKAAILTSAQATPTTSVASKVSTGGRLNVTGF